MADEERTDEERADEDEREESEDANQYGGGDEEMDAVEQTERVEDDDESDEE